MTWHVRCALGVSDFVGARAAVCPLSVALVGLAACAPRVDPDDAAGVPVVAEPVPLEPCEGPGTICTVAGSAGPDLDGDGVLDGARGNNGNNLPALESWLYFPTGVAFSPLDGLPYIVDYNGYRIRRLDPDGILTTVFGDGSHAWAVPGAAPLDSPVENPIDAVFTVDGELLVLEQHTSRILKVVDDTIVIAAGTGDVGYTEDGEPSATALFYEPVGIDVDDEGNVYIADTLNYCIRVIQTDGTVWKIAGNLVSGMVDGPGALAEFGLPQHLAWHDGSLFVSDTFNNVVRRVELATGQTSTFAGIAGTAGYAGDEGPATSATLSGPVGVAVDVDGTVLIADSNNHTIRSVGTDGIIHTIAGTGDPGWTGDAGPATEATLNWPNNVDIAPDGDLYISDTLNSVVRKVERSSL